MLVALMLTIDICNFCYQNKNTNRVEGEHLPLNTSHAQDKMHFQCMNDS